MADDGPIGVDERELDDLALESLAEAVATTPPAALRARLLAAAEADLASRSARRWRAAGAAAAVVALALAGGLVRESNRAADAIARREALEQTVVALEDRLATQGRTLVGLRESLAVQAEVLRVLGGPRVRTAALEPTEGRPGAGRVQVNEATGDAAVVVAGTGALASGRVYQLWALRGEAAPEPAGVLVAAGDDVAVGRVQGLARPETVTAFAVSIEPAGGSKSPTGPIVLVGPVRG